MPVPFVFVISRDAKTRGSVVAYAIERGYDTGLAASYDDAMDSLSNGVRPDAIVVDVQGVPRGESGASFPAFSQWLETSYRDRPPAVAYLLRKGTRRPAFRLLGPVIKKPFPLEAIGAALRQLVGRPLRDGEMPTIELDMRTNTLHGALGKVHLTNIEANLLAYLMQHEGETLNPRHLLVDVWQYSDSTGASTLVRAHISNLRRKVREVAGDDSSIQTIRGKGYRYVA
jgi:DNA-binding response OmpR family regulator